MLQRQIACAAVLAACLACLHAVEPRPVVYQADDRAGPCYLTVDGGLAVCQTAEGRTVWSMRVAAGPDGVLTALQWGAETGSRLVPGKDAMQATLANGTTTRFVRAAKVPPDLGREPYQLPAKPRPEGDAAAAAAELRTISEDIVRLGAAANAAITAAAAKPGFNGSFATLPEYIALARRQAEAVEWFRASLRRSGWIPLSAGPQVATDLAALAGLASVDLRLLATLRAGTEADLAAGASERDAALVIDAVAAQLGFPPPYGSLVLHRPRRFAGGSGVEEVIPVPADLAAVAAARIRAGLPDLGRAAAEATARVVRIGADGREVAPPAVAGPSASGR